MAGKVRRGQAEIIASLIIFGIVLAIIAYLWSFGISASTMSNRYMVERASYLMSKGCENLLVSVNLGNQSAVVLNAGSVESKIRFVVVNTSSGIVLATPSACTVSKIVLMPGDSTSISCSIGQPIGVVTELGNVFLANPQLIVPAISARIKLTPLTLNITSVSSLTKYLYNPSVLNVNSSSLYVGIGGDAGILTYVNASNARVSAVLERVVMTVIGRDLENPNTFDLLITGMGAPYSNTLVVNDETFDLSQTPQGYDIYAYRIIIEGFSGTVQGYVTSLKPGVYQTLLTDVYDIPNAGDVGGPLQLFGYAKRVLVFIYTSDSIANHYTGYLPFVIVSDVDGDGYGDILLDTWSLTVGGASEVDDAYLDNGVHSLATESLEPLILVFRSYPIYSSKYSGVILAIKMRFWDDSIDKTSEIPNEVIVRVGLVEINASGLHWVTWKDFAYNELSRYSYINIVENEPLEVSASCNIIVQEMYFIIPPEYRAVNATLYPAIMIQDPFGFSKSGDSYLSDANVLVDVDYLGISLVG